MLNQLDSWWTIHAHQDSGIGSIADVFTHHVLFYYIIITADARIISCWSVGCFELRKNHLLLVSWMVKLIGTPAYTTRANLDSALELSRSPRSSCGDAGSTTFRILRQHILARSVGHDWHFNGNWWSSFKQRIGSLALGELFLSNIRHAK